MSLTSLMLVDFSSAIAGTCLAWCHPGPSGPFPWSCFPEGQLLAHPDTWGFSSLGAGLCISLGWSWWDSFLPISPACRSPSEWQHKQPSGILITLPSFVPSPNLLKVYYDHTCRSLINKLNGIDLGINSSNWPPGELCATDNSPLSSAVQSIFSPLDWGSYHPGGGFFLCKWTCLVWFSGCWHRCLNWRSKLNLHGQQMAMPGGAGISTLHRRREDDVAN